MIEEYAHLNGSQSTPCSVFQDRASLLERHARKPLDELRHESPVFEIFEQCCDRYAGAAKYPSTTDAFGVTFDLWAD